MEPSHHPPQTEARSEKICSECQGAFPMTEIVKRKGVWICQYCNPTDYHAGGLQKVLWGTLSLALLLLFMGLLSSRGPFRFPGASYAFASIPLLTLIGTGLLEFITGKPVSQASKGWDQLRPWQRGLIVLAVILASLAIFSALSIFIVTHFYQHQAR